MNLVAVMQPTFLPWMGYFAMMAQARHFLYLDDVQLSKQSWQTRNRIKTKQGELMLSVPVASGAWREEIRNAPIARPQMLAKMQRSIAQSLSKAPHFAALEALLFPILAAPPATVGALNIAIIEAIAEALALPARRQTTSDLALPAGDKSDRLVQLTRAVGGDAYLSAPGSIAYLARANPFPIAGMPLRFFQFAHPVYPQLHGDFLPYLSIIDALANLGPEQTRAVLESGLRAPVPIDALTEGSTP